MTVDIETITKGRGWDDGDYRGRDYDQRDHRNGRDWDNDRNGGQGNGQGRGGRHGDGWDNNRNGGQGNGGYRNPGNRGGRDGNNGNFNFFLDQIANTTFESDKEIVAKQLIDSRPITSRQVLMIMNEMTYESTKLEIAKHAYNNTLDKQNYSIVNQGFTYSSSIRKLDRFIRQ